MTRSHILKKKAETSEYLKQIKEGILILPQKKGKPQGPSGNRRPIILLSVLRKILTTLMIGRVGSKIDEELPVNQVTYRAGRGTTE